MKRVKLKRRDFKTEDILSLMEIYLSEWEARTELHWQLNFKFFYADIVVLFLPNLSATLGINLSGIPSVAFPSVAAILSLVFLYFAIGGAKRIVASAKTYAKLINSLPSDLQRISVLSPEIKGGKFFGASLDPILCYAMFLSLFILSIVMVAYNAHNYA